jgi:hypothetical protein
VSVSMSWNEIETRQGVYDFSSFDSSIQPYLSAGAKVNLIVWPATEGGDNNPNNGGSTPAYVFTPAYAVQVGAATPQDMTVCPSYLGDSGNPFYSLATSGGGGVWNVSSSVTNAGDISGLPVSYELPFMTGYQNFIKAVIAHYNTPGAPAIGYIRFGFSQGGENSPECNQYWPGPNGTGLYDKTEYLAYIKTMTDFVRAQNPSMPIMADLHAVGPPGNVDYGYADTEAVDAVADQFGIGTNGLQKSDTSAGICDSDWCSLFAKYAGTQFNCKPMILSLQTLQWSDPTGAAQTGSLTAIEPFAKANGANNLELYLADVAIAFDPGNYCQYPHSVCSSINASTYSGSYSGAIDDFLTP